MKNNPLNLKKPCNNCPFLKEGAIELAEGRLESIIKGLVEDDRSTFQCHKTVHNEKTGGDWDDDGEYISSGKESMCAGAMIYLQKINRPTVAMRIGYAMGLCSLSSIKEQSDVVID